MATQTHAHEGGQVDTSQFRGPAASEEESVDLLIQVLEPDQAHLLAKLLRNHPGLREPIIHAATERMGSEFVGRALSMLAGAAEESGEPAAAGADPDALMQPDFDAPAAERTPSEGGGDELMTPDFDAAPETNTAAQPALDDELMNPYAEEAPAETAAPTQADFVYITSPLALLGSDDAVRVEEHAEFIRENPHLRALVLEGVMQFCPELFPDIMKALAEPTAETQPEPVSESEIAQEPTAQEQAAEPKAESAWVTKAREYNRRHIDLVHRFHELTNSLLADAVLDIDPVLLSRWQEDHGIPPDGRCGPQTVAAAEKAQEQPAADVGPVTSPDQVA